VQAQSGSGSLKYSRKIKGCEYSIYGDESEFRKSHPKVDLNDDWRDAETGDWIRSDDGQVTRVIKRGVIRNNGKEEPFVRTLFGMANCLRTKFLGGEPAKDVWRFGKVSWYQKTLTGGLSVKKRIFAKYVASGLEPLAAYMKAYPDCKSENYASGRVSVLLKSEKVRKLIDEELDVLLSDSGITKSYLLEETKNIIDKTNTRDSDKLRALETLMKISGLLNIEKKTESLALIQEFTGFSTEKLAAFKAGVLPEHGESTANGKKN